MTELATPMMKQYQRIKASHPDTLLLFRLGDFYEMFFEDADIGARELEITLTSRTTGAGQRVAMCGVPYHAVETYISRLVEKGYRVAVCDQMEDPRRAQGLVSREVTRVVTPGTLLDPAVLPEKGNNYIVAISAEPGRGRLGLASLDYSTGEFRTAEYRGPEDRSRFADELTCLEPAEAIVQPAASEDPELRRLLDRSLRRPPVPFRDRAFRPPEAARAIREHFGVASLDGFGCADKPLAIGAAGGLLAYLKETQVGPLGHIGSLRTQSGGEVMALDPATRRNLELVEPLRPGAATGTGLSDGGGGRRESGAGRAGTLLAVLDFTASSAGGRRLRSWVLRPLVSLEAVQHRQAAVAELAERNLIREQLRTELRKVHDLERLVARAATGAAGARDLLGLRDSLIVVPTVLAGLEGAHAPLLRELGTALDPLSDLTSLIGAALADDPPAGLRDGGLVRPGHSAEVDALRESAQSGKTWLAWLESEEKQRTGIKSLKVGFSRVSGYYIEVTRPNLEAVPPDYERRQTVANGERFVTPALKEREVAILGAEERLKELEYELFCGLREKVAAEAARIQATAAALATLDALLSLAEAAARHGYRRPTVAREPGLTIKAGRHPVVERLQSGEEFVPNDCSLGGGSPTFAIITGPNMAGKSTYCRQVALIVLMAQMGGLVPAASARVGLVDRIFTRIGASDELSGGRSTFMVEMSEAANILNHATRRSLIVLDEIGRGTSTYDGLSLAWAVAEHIVIAIGALTLFATHYHELTDLEEELPGVGNYCVTAREVGDDIVFLRKVGRGAVDRSYGIQVARLAGLPAGVLERAREILHQLERAGQEVAATREAGSGTADGPVGGALALPEGSAATAASVSLTAPPARPPRRGPRRVNACQLAFFGSAPSEIEREIGDLDLVNLTPLEALKKLDELQTRVRKGRG